MQTNTFSRNLEPLHAASNSDGNWFMVGTGDISGSSVIQIVNFDTDSGSGSNQKSTTFSYKHPGMITSLSPCPQDYRLAFSCYSSINNNSVDFGATLWQIPGDIMLDNSTSKTFGSNNLLSLNHNQEPLIPLNSIPFSKKQSYSNQQGFLKILWDPSGYSQSIIGLTHRNIFSYSISTDMTDCLVSQESVSLDSLDIFEKDVIACGTWHETSRNIIFGQGSCVFGFDLRLQKDSFAYKINDAHQPRVSSVDGNPHLAHRLVSGGQDGLVKCWDIRNLTTPLVSVSHHTHWIWTVSHNKKYDQLILTSGSDGSVNLESIASVASTSNINQSLFSLDDLSKDSLNRSEKFPGDRLISSYTQHEDSVYSAAWSPSNPWIFASLSYDGQLLAHQVPDNEKYAILL